MVFILTAILGLFSILIFAGHKSKGHSRAYSAGHKMILRFLKTAAVLFSSFAVVTATVPFTAFAYGKHFILDYDIIFWFSCLILILYHRLTTDKTSAVLFKGSF